MNRKLKKGLVNSEAKYYVTNHQIFLRLLFL